jgi:hypothetical protein
MIADLPDAVKGFLQVFFNVYISMAWSQFWPGKSSDKGGIGKKYCHLIIA